MSVRLLQAEAIFDGKNLLPGDFVLIVDDNGVVSDLRKLEKADQPVEKYPGILTPGLVNTHCHLELSHMKGIVPKGTGMVDFLLSVVRSRAADEKEIMSSCGIIAQKMYQQGISVVGDICNTPIMQSIAKQSPLKFYHFVEAIGFDPALAETRFNICLKMADEYRWLFPASVVPHAPYSVSQPLYQLINQQNDHSVISIHHAESIAEQDFFQKTTSDFDRLHQLIKTDLSKHPVSENNSSIQSFLSVFTNKQILLVHNVTISESDLIYIKSVERENNLKIFFSICVRANEYIGNGYPNLELLLRYFPDRLTIGTDSLASNDHLSLLHELSLLKHLYPAITNEQWLRMMTLQGAQALNYDKNYGSFKKGTRPGVVSVDLNNYESLRII